MTLNYFEDNKKYRKKNLLYSEWYVNELTPEVDWPYDDVTFWLSSSGLTRQWMVLELDSAIDRFWVHSY